MEKAQDFDNAVVFKHFEEACSDFQVPATRVAAEQILNQFRQTPNILPTCQYILDHTTSSMVQFQVSSAISDIVVRNYTIYGHVYLIKLRNYMIDYMIKYAQSPPLMKYVREQLLLAAALITKRSLFDVTDQDRKDILLHTVQLLKSDSDEKKRIGLALANALVDQFSNTKSTTIGLTWEHHYKCKTFFESNILLPIFEKVIIELHSFVQKHQGSTLVNEPPLLVDMIVLLEKILQWEFEPIDTAATNILPGAFTKESDLEEFDREDGPSSVKKTFVIFPKQWQPTAGNPEVLNLFFATYSLVQDSDVLSHRCRQCLIQLSGFQKDFFNNDIHIIKSYANTLIQNIRMMLKSITAFGTSPDALSEQGPQMLGMIQITRRLLENTSLAVLCSTPDFFQFLNEVGMITVSCISGTMEDVDEGWINEACDECLQTWVNMADIVSPSDSRGEDPKSGLTPDQVRILTEYINNVAYSIVEAYVNARLEGAKVSDEEDEEEDEIDMGFKDWVTFADQLSCIGVLGRLNPHPTLLYLQHLLTKNLETFKTLFSTQGNNDSQLYWIHEQFHWIILISAHILADSGKGEQPMIPDSLMQLSQSQAYEQDQVVNLSNTFLELLRFTSSFGSNTMEASYCSPRVAETLIWYMERWSKTYLLVDENEYSYISPNIAKALGRPGPSDGQGIRILDFFIEQMKANFMLWNADPDTLTQLVKWLHSCGTSNNLKHGLLQSDHFPQLVQFFTQNLEQLPEIVHTSLIQTIATISSFAIDETTRNNYFGLMFKTIEESLGLVLHRSDFQRTFQNPDIMNKVINSLEMFDGLALACQFNNTKTIFSFCSKFFSSLTQLMSLYKSVPQVQVTILQLFSDLCNQLDFGLLSEEEKQALLGTVMEIVRIFGISNHGKKRMHSQEEEEDKPYADISTILAMLSNIMASEVEDFSRKEYQQQSSSVADVVFFGINTVIPMIDMEMLKIPSVCQKYIQLISHLIEMFPDKLAGLPGPLFNNLMASLEYGTKHDIPDVNILTLHAIAPLAMWAYKQQQQQHAGVEFIKGSLHKFLRELLDSLLFKHLDTSVVEAASDALLALILVQREVYMTLANEIISLQSTEIQTRLSYAFQKLDGAIPQQLETLSNNHRNAVVSVPGFKKSLLEFLMNVRAVLRVK